MDHFLKGATRFIASPKFANISLFNLGRTIQNMVFFLLFRLEGAAVEHFIRQYHIIYL